MFLTQDDINELDTNIDNLANLKDGFLEITVQQNGNVSKMEYFETPEENIFGEQETHGKNVTSFTSFNNSNGKIVDMNITENNFIENFKKANQNALNDNIKKIQKTEKASGGSKKRKSNKKNKTHKKK